MADGAQAGRGAFGPGTIAQRVTDTGGRSTGFDYLRVGLSSLVIFSHSWTLSYFSGSPLAFQVDHDFWPARPFLHMIIAMFFGLSGFLVAGSLERCRTLVGFFGLRILRIVPALAFEVTISALVIGPLFTLLPLREYFADPKVAHYFLNIVGDIHYRLPGLFLANPRPGVANQQLWTIPVELACYAIIGALAATAIVRRRVLLLALLIVGQAYWLFVGLQHPFTHAETLRFNSPATLLLCFLTGLVLYAWRDRVRYSGHYAIAALAICIVLGYTPQGANYQAIPAVYLSVYLGLLNPPSCWLVRGRDYSYGLYLYGYPIQQMIATFPALRHWYVNFPLAIAITLPVAMLSWHFVEKPVLKWRSALPAIEAALSRLWLGVRDPAPHFAAAARAAPPMLAVLTLAGALTVAAMVDLRFDIGFPLALLALALAALQLRLARAQAAAPALAR